MTCPFWSDMNNLPLAATNPSKTGGASRFKGSPALPSAAEKNAPEPLGLRRQPDYSTVPAGMQPDGSHYSPSRARLARRPMIGTQQAEGHRVQRKWRPNLIAHERVTVDRNRGFADTPSRPRRLLQLWKVRHGRILSGGENGVLHKPQGRQGPCT